MIVRALNGSHLITASNFIPSFFLQLLVQIGHISKSRQHCQTTYFSRNLLHISLPNVRLRLLKINTGHPPDAASGGYTLHYCNNVFLGRRLQHRRLGISHDCWSMHAGRFNRHVGDQECRNSNRSKLDIAES
jgi:hypothetical protein